VKKSNSNLSWQVAPGKKRKKEKIRRNKGIQMGLSWALPAI